MPTLQNGHLRAEIATRGAELIRLQDTGGADFLWNGDPNWWDGCAPLLFPIVGKVPNDTIVVDGKEYPMRQHGFARASEFTVARADDTECFLRLEASSQTREHYPFDFILEVRHVIGGPSLLTEATVWNVDDRPMPVSLGFHPALRWPLDESDPRSGHVLLFADREAGPIRRLQDGLLARDLHPSPVVDRRLELDDHLFDDGAMIFDQLTSRRIDYVAPSGRSVTVDFPCMPHLGVWTKPGAGFICIEPWQGYAAPLDFAGELSTKEGMIALAPGSTAKFSMRLVVRNQAKNSPATLP
jgi:galactose mutarotase-like enzyme